MKKNLLLLLFLVAAHTLFAQTSGKFSIKGTVVDTAGQKMPFATTMLLLPKDSSLVTFGRTNDEGILEFKNVKKGKYLLKINYVGYLPYQKEIDAPAGDVLDMGTIPMKILNQDLYEVVIKTARAPLSIRGDTVEYNASSFKVPPGSTVEDLIRKLPGMQVDQDGNIRAQGEEVKRVTVDGKRFFGDDPKMVTKNLPAEAINKVQVFNGKTEASKATGVDDGKREKTVNLELKDSHKKGGFGKATAGVGTDSRLEGKVSYNKFDQKQQFSVLGFGNNVNQSGIARDDYQDFKGSQSWNWGDDGDFGFSGGTRSIDEGGGGITIGPSWGGGGSDGYSKNWAGGVNYNYDNKKTKLSTSYFYSQSDLDKDVFTNRETFLSSGSFRAVTNSESNNFTGNHRPSFRFEKELDSLNTIILISNSRINNGDSDYKSFLQNYRVGNDVFSQSKVDNSSLYNSFAISNLLLYRHKFKKKGRNFAASLGFNVNNSDGTDYQRSVNEFFQDPTQNSTVNLRNETESLRNQMKGSLSYIEPLGKKFYWESFYNYSLRRDKVDRDVFNVSETNQDQINEGLTRYYTNEFTYNRLGTKLRYSYKGLNISAGLAGQQIELDGKFARNQNSTNFSRVNRTFSSLVPNAGVSYDLKNNRYLWADYTKNVQEPSISDLQPIVDNSNPLFISEGNPDLAPEVRHTVQGGFQKFSPATFTNLYIGANYTYYENQNVNTRTIDENLVTHSRPVNLSGGNNFSTYMGFGFPLKKTVSTLSFNANVGRGNNLNYINDVVNETRSGNYGFGVRLDYTPNEVFTVYTNANWNFTDTKYSINTSQNQKFNSGNYGADMNIKMPKEIYFSSRFSYRTYTNDQFGFNQKQPILNLAIYKIILKSKKGEIRLSANDVFKKNLGISQSASVNFYTESRVATLSRYFMLSFTYNMRGMSASVRRKGFY